MVKSYILRPMTVIFRYLLKRPVTFPYRGKVSQRDSFYRMQDRLDLIEEPYYAINFKHTPHVSPRTRGTLGLNLENCTGCAACARICPNKCIEMTVVYPQPPDWTKKKPFRAPSVFLARCMHCGLCTVMDACRFDAMHHTPYYDSAEITLEAQYHSYTRLHENWKRWDQAKQNMSQSENGDEPTITEES
ncbi:MAG: hypothetical protein ACE5OZ_07625 [Candidatus Heimdallarchaeota archaeon]